MVEHSVCLIASRNVAFQIVLDVGANSTAAIFLSAAASFMFSIPVLFLLPLQALQALFCFQSLCETSSNIHRLGTPPSLPCNLFRTMISLRAIDTPRLT